MKKIYALSKNKIAALFILLLLNATAAFSQTDVLVCGAASPQSWLDDVQNKLVGTGSFNSVQTFNTYTGTPTLAYMQSFDAILVYTDYGCADPTTFGNNLAAYIDGGGGVVNAVFSTASVLIGGNFNTVAYQVVIPVNGQTASPTLTLGTIVNPCSPVMTNITSFNGGSSSYRSPSSTLATGGQFVAQWSDGEWLVADRSNVGPMNARRVDLNFYPPSSDVRGDFWDASTQGAQIMGNALLWVAGVTNYSAVPSAPAAITGASAICDGATTTYTIAPVIGATTYTWVAPAGTIIQSGQNTTSITIIGGSTSGNITVTANNACGSSTPTTFTLTINPLPNVVANATSLAVCDGSPVTLSGSGATSYTWTASVTDNVAFTPTATNTYTVTGTDANGCVSTDAVSVTVNPLPTVAANSTAPAVCDGTPVTLSGSGNATSYAWTGSVSDNVPFTPNSTDTYTVTGTDANGCENTATISVTVNALPAVVANATSTSICDGSSVTLSGSGATSYTWTGSVTDNVAFTPTVTDSYTVTGTDANGCVNSDAVTVTVNSLPAVIANASATTICNGSPVTLFGSGAATYTWAGSVAVTDNVPFTPAATDTYTVTGTDANGCTGTDMITVAVNALPTVVGNASASAVCAGTPVTLTGSGATTYTWTGSVTDNVPFTPASTMSYTVTGTDANGCQNSDEVTVTVNPLPNVTGTSTATSICIDDANATLSGSPAGGMWSGPGVSGSSFDPTTAGIGPHPVVYAYTDANGCSGSASVTITVNACTGVVESSSDNNLNVYPNPNNGTFMLAISSAAGDVKIEVLDMQGRVVYASTENNVAAGFVKEISSDEMANGIYMVRVTDNETQRVIKVSVQK